MNKLPIPTFSDDKKADRSFVCTGCQREHPLHHDTKDFKCLCGVTTNVEDVSGWCADSEYGPIEPPKTAEGT